jgi:hypothetical protein
MSVIGVKDILRLIFPKDLEPENEENPKGI